MTWFPLASSIDLAPRTTFHAQLLGRELVAWRADDGGLNLWENRCLHRGVRLTIGLNDGAELVCQYHGWRYANQTAGCTYIPAHPADAPARTICNRTYPVQERYGLVWGTDQHDAPEMAGIDALDAGSHLALRPIPVNAPPESVTEALADYGFQTSGALSASADNRDRRSWQSSTEAFAVETLEQQELRVTLRATGPDGDETLVVWAQPVDAHRSVIRGVLARGAEPSSAVDLAVLKHHNSGLSRLRDAAEVAAAAEPMPSPLEVEIVPVSVELAGVPTASAGRTAPLRVQVARKWDTAAGIAALELASIGEVLPTFQPGAHIDVHLPNGLVRQYSLTNGPGELNVYRIGVKLEPDSAGGSLAIHDSVREGDVLAISAPRNNFPLRRDSERTVLLAGGIGLTPLLSMAQSLRRNGLRFELALFSASADVPFPEVVARLGSNVTHHIGLDPAATRAAIARTLGPHTQSAQVYVCGPAPMIQATIATAAELGWPVESVHFEYFANPNQIDDSSEFEVALARSAKTVRVREGETILETLRANGVELASSCEQGACGTCVAPVIEGDIDHQDVFLNAAERAAGETIVTCVSRAASGRLVLDL